LTKSSTGLITQILRDDYTDKPIELAKLNLCNLYFNLRNQRLLSLSTISIGLRVALTQ